ncbi:MAG: hypothetical protein ACLP5H_15755 [Desulfomonilaceae bacterium]
MRTAIIVIVIILAIVLLGGVVNLGGAPIFSHIDSVLGTDVLMSAHNTIFFFLSRAQHRVEEESSKAGEEVKKFQEEPLGIETKGRYKKLDDAASN